MSFRSKLSRQLLQLRLPVIGALSTIESLVNTGFATGGGKQVFILMRNGLCVKGSDVKPDDRDIFSRLMSVIEDRRENPSEKSYTTSLLASGTGKIAEKILEEASEVVEAAAETDPAARDHLIHEAADLIFHLLVMLGYKSIAWQEIEAELSRRFGTSGLDEKAARTSSEAPES